VKVIFPQTDEQALRLAFLGEKSGYFVEVGANDPVSGSQTWELEQRGWSGVLVEPQPSLAAKLGEQRSAKVFAAACSSRVNSGQMLPLYLAGGASSFDKRLQSPIIRPHGTINVPLRTLDEILIEAGAPTDIDFMSIDVEGHEIEVLDGFDLARWRPKLLMIEDFLLHLRVHRCLVRRGYQWLRRTGINNWYVPQTTKVSLGVDGLWQFYNKHYFGLPSRKLRARWRRWRAAPQFVDSLVR
jgi:FkbM family methyltransferase